MAEDVLEKLSAAIGRKITPESTAKKPVYVAGENVKGLKEPGNIDITNRPVVPNPAAGKGQSSTVLSMGIEEDGKHVLIPMVSDGADGKPPRIMNKKEAIDYYHKTKKHLGIFDSDAAADEYGRNVLHPQQATLKNVNGRTSAAPDLSSIIGRRVEPEKVSPLAMQRFKMYSQARTNGFDPDAAMKTAMSTAGTVEGAPGQSMYQKAKSAFANVPLAPGATRTLGDVGKDISEVLHRAWANPMAMSDSEWASHQQNIDKFFDDYLQQAKAKIGEPTTPFKKFQTGAAQFEAGAFAGTAKTAAEFTSPGQIALLVGTFGESALARVAAKTGIAGAVPAAKTIAKLLQLNFTASMIEGTATGVEDTFRNAIKGDWKAAGQSAAEGLISGVMAKSAIDHETAQIRVRADLEKVARDKYGAPAGHPVTAAITSRFNQLDPFRQAAVIDEAVKQSKEYQDILKDVDDKNADAKAETRKQQRGRLNDYYGRAMSEAWDENVARRTLQGLQRGRQAVGRMEEASRQADTKRAQEEHVREQQSITLRLIEEHREMDRQAAAKQRIERGQEAASERSQVGRISEVLSDKRNDVFRQRQEFDSIAPAETAPRRQIEAVVTPEGQVAYPAMFWGEENHFGVAGDLGGHAVYRQTPRGTEWLGTDGNFSEAPESVYMAAKPEEADTMARLGALTAEATYRAEEEGGEHVKDADELSAILRDYSEGEIDAKEARKRAGIADTTKLPDEYTAARDGRLNGPFYDSSARGYYDGLAEEARTAGLTEEETNELLNEAGMLSRQQTENNLHHVSRPGDYVVSGKGIKWTLDSKGVLHSDEGGAVPLLKRGLYSNDALQLAGSGRVGYGTQTRDERRASDARRRQTEADIRQNQEQVDREMRLAVQRQDITPAAETEPRADTIDKDVRRQRFMTRPPRAEESQVGAIVRMVLTAPTDAKSVIKAIAARNGVSEQEVMRLQIAADPDRLNAPEAKVARLEIGDTITDDFRKDRPWKVEQGKDGNLYLRSGNASPLKLDRLNPSDRVKDIVNKGKVTQSKLDFTEAEVSQAAFDRPHYVSYQDRLTDEVRERIEGTISDPEARTPAQVEQQAVAAIRRSDAADAVATRAVIDSVNPPADVTSVEQAEGAVDDAQEKVKVAEKAYSQAAEAESKSTPADPFPDRAPVSVGYVGPHGMIVQNGHEISFHYEVVPIDSLVASHNWNGPLLEVNPEFPEPLQPRTISEAESKLNDLRAQRRVTSENGKTQGYDFREYADKTVNGSMGPAIIDPRGWIVGGNTRISIMRRHLDNLRSIGDVEEREAALLGFRSAMRQLASEDGVAGYPDDGSFNAVVRVLDKPIATNREAAELGRLFNKSVSVQIRKSAKGISYAKSLDTPLMEEIGRRTEAYDGLTPAMQADPEFFRDIVSEKFSVTPEEYADWFDDIPGRGLVLNDQGRQQFTKAMMGTVIKDAALLNRIEGRTPYRAAERAITYLIKMQALTDRDIVGKITEALNASAETMNTDPGLSLSNDRWLATYHPDQQQFLGMETSIPPEPDRMVEALWRALTASDAAVPRVFNDRLKSFIGQESSLAGNIFEEQQETPAEAFNRAFKKELKEVAFSRKDKQEAISQDEYDAALRNRELSDAERFDAENTPETEGGRGQSPEQAEGAQAPGSLSAGDPFATTSWERGEQPGELMWVDHEGDYPVSARLLASKERAEVAIKDEHGLVGTVVIGRGEWPKEEADRVSLMREKMKGAGDFNDKPEQAQEKIAERMAKQAAIAFKHGSSGGRMTRPPEAPTKASIAARDMAITKAEKGYVTPDKLKEFLASHPATKGNVNELMRTARMMSEYVFDADPPVGVDRKQALDWVLRERLAGIEAGELKTKRGQYSDPLIEKGVGDAIMKLHKAADPSTFIHEFAHVIFPMLSDEDLKAIDTIEGPRGKGRWDGERKNLTKDVYVDLSEKLASGMERFLRDENPTGFTHEVKAVLAKVKEMMRKVYSAFAKDPLSGFNPTEEAREVFSKMFGITTFDVQDRWSEELKKARTEEKRMKKPDEEAHPLQKIAADAGATGIRNTIAGKVEDSAGERVDPRKPSAALVFPDEGSATAFWDQVVSGKGKISNAELIQAEDGSWGVRFNTKTKVPNSVLYQDVPKKHPGLELEEKKKRLAETPASAAMVRKLLQLQIQNLENEIRSKYGAETEPAAKPAEVASQARQEVKNVANANAVREAAHANAPLSDAGKPPAFSQPPRPPRSADAGAGSTGRVRPDGKPVARAPRSLAEVREVNIQPLARERSAPVGTVEGEEFNEQKWKSTLAMAGLPENLPPPTWALNRKTAEKLIFPGQKEVVQAALSAFEQGDGFAAATATGTGKTYTGMAIIKEWRDKHPDARILYITKNQKLLKNARGVSEGTFGFEMEKKLPDRDAPAGTYGITYMGMIADPKAENTHWDMVIADESGEARNWFKEDNQQGKKLMAVTANADKVGYFSATPWHSPMEYGYMTKLNLWPKNGFDRWIEGNFAHEKIDGKVIGKLDPAKQAKLRQQLIERGQLVSQAISYDGFTAHFGVVPVTDSMKRGLDRIHEGFARAKKQLIDTKKKGLAEKVAAFEATYTKAFLERERLPQAIELAQKARRNGWQVMLFSETSSEDLFRRGQEEGEEPSTYQQLDMAMGGQLSRIIPPFPNIYDRLQQAFGSQIGDYSGRGNSMGEREKALTDYLTGERPMIYSTYAAGGIGVSLHDADFPELGISGGERPRVAIFLGPPYSGVLLEQAMGRSWRFGVKSDTHSVFLATDSEPDVRLMQEKVGPRMRALRASVLGERDSLASVMATYNDEEKTRARQESLAYQEGNEPEISAQSFQVRSKSRDVGINDWSQINFPPADTAKNKGMKYGEHVPGGDWSNLYQSKFGMLFPDSPEQSAGKDSVDSIGNGLATGQGLPPDVSVQNLDPADRDVVVGAAASVATDAVDASTERDAKAAARQSMQSQMQLPGDKDKWILTFPNRRQKIGVWRYTGDPADLPRRAEASGDEDITNSRPKDIRTWYGGAAFTQEVGIKSIATRAGAAEAGENIVRMNRSYQADADVNFADFAMEAHDIAEKHKLDTRDPKTMNDLWDAVEGKRVIDNPAINAAVNDIANLHERIHSAEGTAGVKLKTPSGEVLSWKQISKDRNYMPHRIDWDAQVQDPVTGETHTLRDIMKETFAEASRRRIIDAIAKERNYTYDQVVDYLRAYAPNTPVLSHIHRARTIDFPFIKKDWRTLMSYYRQAADAIAIEKNFGSDRGKLDKEIARIPSENGRRTIQSMFDGLLEPQEWQDWTAKAYNAAIAFEAATKMTISVTKVPFHLVHIPMGLKGRVMPLVKAIARDIFDHKDVMDNATYVGTIARQLNAADVIAKGEDSQGITHQIFGKTGFNAAYKQVRAIAGESSRIWMEQYAMKELRKDNSGEARRILRDVMLVGDKAIDQAIAIGRFTPEDLAKGQTAFANLTTWSNNPLQMPGWARLHIERNDPTTMVGIKRAVRLTYALQSFALKSTSLLREQLYDEVVHHKNLKPLAYAVIAYPVIGQLLAATGAGAKHFVHKGIEGLEHKEHENDSWDKFFANLEDTFEHPEAVKFLKFYIDGWTLGVGWDRVRRWTDPFLNAAIGKNKEAQSGLTYLLKDEGEQLIGPAFSDLVEFLGFGVDVGKIEIGQKHPEQKKEKVEAAAKKETKQIVPILGQVPGFTNPPKAKTTRPHY
jgi:hypothetical protein